MSDSSPSHGQVQRGLILQRQGRYKEAENYFREALGANPSDAFSLLHLAICQRQQDRPEEALATILRGIQEEPNNPDFHSVHSFILSDLKKYDQALATAETALTLDPEAVEGYIAMGVAQAGKEKWAEVEKAARQALALDPNDNRAANQLAFSLRLQNKMAENAAQIESMLRRNPEDAYTHNSAGWAALQTGDHRTASTHFSEALRLKPSLESARVGLLESFKARSPFYRIYLNYCFFMQRLSKELRWALIIGLVVAVNLSSSLATGNGKPIFLTVFAIYLLFVLWTHVAPAVGNLIILTDRLARHALTSSEKWMGILGGGGIVIGLVAIPLGLFCGWPNVLLLGLTTAGAAFPFRYAFGNESKMGPWVFGSFGALVLGAGLFCWVSGVIGGVDEALRAQITKWAFYVVLLTTWLANVPALRQKRVTS